MPNWNETLAELQANSQGPHDRLRHKYLKRLARHTGRNVLVYYSGWLQKSAMQGVDFHITDADKIGFMTCSKDLDRSKGLDLFLHTPGGDVAATESIIDYLHSLYSGNIRAVVPQISMSGGTLMAVACREILMGRQSSIGPVDPQIAGMPAQGILEEFKRAVDEVQQNNAAIPIWQPIIQKYWPTLITSCEHAVDWSDSLLRDYLKNCMFQGEAQAVLDPKLDAIANLLGKQSTSKSHNRHINPVKAAELGLKVVKLEDDQKLQDLVLTLHHSLILTFAQTAAVKIIENDRGVSYLTAAQAINA
ncbi:S49 family peptidase [Xanthomonas sp. LMG 12459]|uniref:SDH family Clp fold serine proteinase n=1 Tax=Xanthomonas sp. LMG 12459 TaxID=1591131 RepID=UPI0012631627|nr:S49 family peptidase [Xanthomonas sp. LMG 12459]KAB7778861.1 serine protease [Xanthomonas sp. LMG 12459]